MAMFRERALAVHRRGDRPGRPLHIVPGWARWATRVTVLMVVSGLAFAALAPVGEYAEGTAIVRREGRVAVTTSVPGTVVRVDVRPGERVEAGEVVVQLDDSAEQAELERVERAYRQRLVELLRNPEQSARRERLVGLDAELQVARAHLRARGIRASSAGSVSDVRARPGQRVTPGDAVVSIEQEDAEIVVVGLFPGHYRPLLDAADTELYLELEGFPDTRIKLPMGSVADGVIGPAEAMRYLGPDREGTLQLTGPVVVVETVLPSDSFESDDTHYQVYDGMQGRLEAKVRAATLLESLVPALRRF